MEKSLPDKGNLTSSIARLEYLKELIAEAHLRLDKHDEATERMIDDGD